MPVLTEEQSLYQSYWEMKVPPSELFFSNADMHNLVHEIILWCLIKRKWHYKTVFGDYHQAFTWIPHLYLLNNLVLAVLLGRKERDPFFRPGLCVFSLRRKSIFKITPLALASHVYPEGLLIYPLTQCSETGLVLQTPILLHLKHQKNGRSSISAARSVVFIIWMNWLPGTNVDIGIFWDLKTVAVC